MRLHVKKTLYLILAQTHFLNNIDLDLNDCLIHFDFFVYLRNRILSKYVILTLFN